MKQVIIIALGLLSFTLEEKPTVQPNDLSDMIGNWKGSLSYLDYTSHQQVTIPANFSMAKISSNNKAFIVQFYYTDEPNANTADTLIISDKGKKIDDYTVVSNQFEKGSRIIVATKKEADGNDHKMALIRKTYKLSKDSLTIRKEVKFDDSAVWLTRHTYQFGRS